MKELVFPEGKKKCLTLSFDDEITQDRRLIEILKKYNLKCTFNLNSGTFGQQGTVEVNGRKATHNKIEKSEAKELYKGFEIAVHTVNHPDLTKLTKDEIVKEVAEDMKALSEIAGYPVNGFAYPYGTYNDTVVNTLKECGIIYGRTVCQTKAFGLPEDFVLWHPSGHFDDDYMDDLTEKFVNNDEPMLFYAWGHSYEFDANDSWEHFEDFCQKVSGLDDVWYATNGEVVNWFNSLD